MRGRLVGLGVVRTGLLLALRNGIFLEIKCLRRLHYSREINATHLVQHAPFEDAPGVAVARVDWVDAEVAPLDAVNDGDRQRAPKTMDQLVHR